MTIPPRFMDDLRDRIALSDIVGKRVKLTRAGHEFKGCCPFHNEKTPSFTVNDEKQFYHCFGCGAHGDAIGFVMQQGNLSFIDAIEMLATEAGMSVPQQTPQEIEKAKKQKDVYNLMEDTSLFFEKNLYALAGHDSLDYMIQRGVDKKLMDAFRVGFAPTDGQALYRHLKKSGYEEQQMVDAGVIRRSTRGGAPYSFFRDRIMFPVADRRGRVVAFGGRILPDHLRAPANGNRRADFTPPKYINSSESSLFHKGRMLYGESHARQAAGEGASLIVVEGYLDVMACFSAGYKGAVAPLGTALTEEQIMILWKMIPARGENRSKNPVLCFDGDNAGRRAATRACERILPLLQPDQSALFAFLPEGQDPDSMIRAQGKESFGKVIHNAVPLVDFIWEQHTAGRRFDTPESKAGLAKTLEESALKIADRMVQQYYRQTFREKLYQTFTRSHYRKKGKYQDRNKEPVGPVSVGKPLFSADSMPYQVLLATVINHPEIFDQVEEDLGHLKIVHERLDLLRQAVLNTLGENTALDSDALQTYLKEQGFLSELCSVLSESVYTHAGFARPKVKEDKIKEDGMNEDKTGAESILKGWREIGSLMQKRAVMKELKAAGKALGEDFSKDNEDKVMALHDVHKASEG